MFVYPQHQGAHYCSLGRRDIRISFDFACTHPTMCIMSFNVDHSKHSSKNKSPETKEKSLYILVFVEWSVGRYIYVCYATQGTTDCDNIPGMREYLPGNQVTKRV